MWRSRGYEVFEKVERTEAYVATNDIEKEATGFGAGIPDIAPYYDHLEKNKNLPVEDFKKAHSQQYITKLNFDPCSAKYFDMFMDKSKRPQSGHYSLVDFSLSSNELEKFRQNGFVVGPQEKSMGQAYYNVYNNDLPVLVTTDSILHAFHKSYDSMLENLETSFCSTALMNVFEGMREALIPFANKYKSGPFSESLKDADFFITVGMNLLNSEQYYDTAAGEAPPVAAKPSRRYYDDRREQESKKALLLPKLGDVARVKEALKACKDAQKINVDVFGKNRKIDFTLFKPRGHYAKSAPLRQYFRSVSWLGEIDMILAGESSNPRQLGAAVVLHMLVNEHSKTQSCFREYNNIIEALVGPSDSMDMKQLSYLMNEVFSMKDYDELNSEAALTNLQAKIMTTDVGVKKYNSSTARSRSFTFAGKKFAIDGWAHSKFISHDRGEFIEWEGRRVERHSVSAVDVAFAVLHNDDATSVLLKRMHEPRPQNPYRDGHIFHTHLAAVRQTVDALPEESWKTSIYMYWLSALRKLTAPKDSRFPQAMLTEAYGMKNMNTQLGSWAQLRHDNLLYVQQPERDYTYCDYPAGYVEPFVEFWQAMERLCMAVADAIRGHGNSSFFEHFAKHMKVLHDISALELANKPLDKQQIEFLKNVVELHETFGSGASTTWLGWYPSLFYTGAADATNPDLIACDTFTNPPSENDPGCVLHQTLGYPRRMLMAVDSGKDVAMYAGPVFGFYEFELPGLQRMSDEQWKAQVKANQVPPFPEWTSSYMSLL